MLDDYRIGMVVTYMDDSATVSDPDDMALVTGPINGEPVFTSERVYVPVWSPRDNGRESATIMVAAENIVGPSDMVLDDVPGLRADNEGEGEVR
jgi:hypothetical protein